MMAELGHNYNIQCMKLFQELKAAYPATPDELVRQCMKANRNVKEKCEEDLEAVSQHPQGRFNKALLSHQLEQLFKLERELRQERQEMGAVKADVQDMEMKVKQQAFSLQSQSTKVQAGEVRRLNSAIGDLRGACDSMVKKVTTLTGGKVPLGEDSIKDYKPYLSQDTVPDSRHCDTGAAVSSIDDEQLGGGGATSETLVGRWNCSECTFANHPSLETCEICEMPRITMGATNKEQQSSRTCFCHPKDSPGASHIAPPP